MRAALYGNGQGAAALVLPYLGRRTYTSGMAARRVVEIERKFDVEEETLLPSLQDLPGVARVDEPVEHRLEAEYFDTKDLRLAAAAITLRRGSGGEDGGWHLKLPKGPDDRTEFRELLGEQADGVPDALLRLVRVHTRGDALVPVARLMTTRTPWSRWHG